LGTDPGSSATPSPGADGIGDTYYPGLGNGGYDVEHYTIVLDVQPLENVITGTTTITAHATQPLSAFNLDFGRLPIDFVTINGRAAEYTQDGRELTLTPAAPLAARDVFSAVVAYHGSPQPLPSDALPGETTGWFHTDGGAINVVNEPDGAASWFPSNNHPRDKATYRFELTVPAPFVAAAPGLLRETVEEGEKVRYIWEMDKPMASYLAAVNIDDYDVVTAPGPDGVTIRSYFPKDYPPAARQAYATLPEMIDYFSGVFGPYPYAAYGVLIADAQSTVCRGMLAAEIQALSTHCPSPRAREEEVVVHELVHQWFGDSVSLENWQDMWLKEGLATYGQWLWQLRGKEIAPLNELAGTYRRQLDLDAPISRPPPDDLYSRDAVYIGGALVFHALRLQVGDEAFFEILRAYYARYQDSYAGTQDFIAVAEEVSGQDLEGFFQAWLYSTELPSLPAGQ
jgi:aminopeptidase N